MAGSGKIGNSVSADGLHIVRPAGSFIFTNSVLRFVVNVMLPNMKTLEQLFAELGISVVRHEHPAVFTVEESNKHFDSAWGAKTKNLFLRNKSGSQHYLYSLPGDKRADIKALAAFVGEQNLSFASPERLLRHLGLTPGSVTPLGLIHDTDRHVIYLIDRELWSADRVCFHPNINTATLELTTHDFQKFLDRLTVDYKIF